MSDHEAELLAIADAMVDAAAAGNHDLLDELADMAEDLDGDEPTPDDDPTPPTPEAQQKGQADHEALVARLFAERASARR